MPASHEHLTVPGAGAPDADAGEAGSPSSATPSDGGEGGEPLTVAQHPGSRGRPPTVNPDDDGGEAGAVVYTAGESGTGGRVDIAGTGGAGAAAVADSGGSSGAAAIGGTGGQSVGGAEAGGVAGSGGIAGQGGAAGAPAGFCPVVPAAYDSCEEAVAPGIYSFTVPWQVTNWKVKGSAAQRYWAGTNMYYRDVGQQNPCTDEPMFTTTCATLKGEGTTSPTYNQSYILTIYVEVLEGQTLPCVTTTTTVNQTLSCG